MKLKKMFSFPKKGGQMPLPLPTGLIHILFLVVNIRISNHCHLHTASILPMEQYFSLDLFMAENIGAL